MKQCLCCRGRGSFKGRQLSTTPLEFPDPCIVCNGMGLLPNNTLKPKPNDSMPILKKKQTANSSKSAPASVFEVGDKVLLLDENDEEVQGEITAIDKKTKTATIDCGDNNYEEELTKLKPFKGEEEPEPEPEPKNRLKSKSGKATSLGSIFKKAKAAPEGGGGGFPAGNWEALIVGASTEIDKQENTRGIFEVVGVGDDEVEGKKAKIGYTLMNKDGSEGAGMEYFKRDLVKLNVETDGIETDEDLENALEEVSKAEPWIDVTAKPQKDNPQYVNIYIDGLKDDQDNKPEAPAF